MKREEAELEDGVLRALSAPDVAVWKNEIGTGYRFGLRAELCDPCGRKATKYRLAYGVGGPGAPDLIACIAGGFLGFELKSSDGEVRPTQRAFMASAERVGVPIVVVRTIPEALKSAEAIRAWQRRG